VTIPALLCFDVEPDEFHLHDAPEPSWPGFERLAMRAVSLRDALADASGRPAAFSWYLRLDPQIEVAYGSPAWAVERYESELEQLTAAGDELGAHPHAWRRDEEGWFHDHADDRWVEHCVGVALRTFEVAFGHPPFAYRGGDRFIDPTVVHVLEAAGVGVDLTLEPGATAVPHLVPGSRSTGLLPAVPSHLSRPFLSGRLLRAPLLAALDLTEPSLDEHPPMATLSLTMPTRTFRVLLASRLRDGDLTHLAFAVRSDVGSQELVGQRVDENLRHVAQLLGDAIEWTTPTQAFERLHAAATSSPVASRARPPHHDQVRRIAVGLRQAVDDAERSIVELAKRVRELELARRELLEAGHAREDERQALDDELARLRAEVGDDSRRLAQLHQDLHDVSTELHRIQPAVAEVEDLRRQLEALRSTRWWRLHERAHPLLAALVRRRPVR
jgi:hypothetical protein